jgi:hypothetical protein
MFVTYNMDEAGIRTAHHQQISAKSIIRGIAWIDAYNEDAHVSETGVEDS